MFKMLQTTTFGIFSVFSFKSGGKESESFWIRKNMKHFQDMDLKYTIFKIHLEKGLVRAVGIVVQTKMLIALFDEEGSACLAKIDAHKTSSVMLGVVQHAKQEEVSPLLSNNDY